MSKPWSLRSKVQVDRAFVGDMIPKKSRPNEAGDEAIQNKDESNAPTEKIKALRLKQEEEMKELQKMNDSALKSLEENNKKSVAALVKTCPILNF